MRDGPSRRNRQPTVDRVAPALRRGSGRAAYFEGIMPIELHAVGGAAVQLSHASLSVPYNGTTAGLQMVVVAKALSVHVHSTM